MKFSIYTFNFFKCVVILSSFLLLIVLCNVFCPTVIFALGPDEAIDYYGNTEYIGKDPYGHSHKPRPLGTFYNRAELEGNPISELGINSQQYTPYRPLGTVYNRAELDGLYSEDRSGVRIGYLAPSVQELNAMSMQGTVSTDTFDRELFKNRFESMKEIIKTYHIDEKKSFFKSIVVTYQTVNENITALYIKSTEVTKRKVYWTVWAKGRGKYNSYEEFKRTWDSNTGFWSRLEKSVRSDVRKDVEDLLGINEIKRELKKSVKKEVEKALKRNNTFVNRR